MTYSVYKTFEDFILIDIQVAVKVARHCSAHVACCSVLAQLKVKQVSVLLQGGGLDFAEVSNDELRVSAVVRHFCGGANLERHGWILKVIQDDPVDQKGGLTD